MGELEDRMGELDEAGIMLERDCRRWRVRVAEFGRRPLASGFVYGGSKMDPARFDPSTGKSYTAVQLRAIAARMDALSGAAE